VHDWFPDNRRSRLRLREEVGLTTHQVRATAEKLAETAALVERNTAALADQRRMLESMQKELQVHTRQTAELVSTFRFMAQLRKAILGLAGAVVLYAGTVTALKDLNIDSLWSGPP
jgi:lipid II:glycine glycyltransferase (peptidoglycan interpeptide bridge formation enzyme)